MNKLFSEFAYVLLLMVAMMMATQSISHDEFSDDFDGMIGYYLAAFANDPVFGNYPFREQFQFSQEIADKIESGDRLLDILLDALEIEPDDFDPLAMIDEIFGDGVSDGLMTLDIGMRAEMLHGFFGLYFDEFISDELQFTAHRLVLPVFATYAWWVSASPPPQLTQLQNDHFELYELTFGTDDLEERVALMVASQHDIVLMDLYIQAEHDFNIFLVNRDVITLEFSIWLDAPLDFEFEGIEMFETFRLQPGEAFTVQVPVQKLGEFNSILVTPNVWGGGLRFEAGFRLTDLPLPGQ